jgi:tetratricopeptide (TPR) repeat protein
MSHADTLEELISADQKIAVLAGAGVSIPPPSRLPAGGAFMSGLIKTIAPPELVEELLAFSNPFRADRKSAGDFLRFEGLLQLVRETVDPSLEVLDILDDEAHQQPNLNHFFLATLIGHGHTVFTTNFDALIEAAAVDARIGIACKPVINSEDFAASAQTAPAFPLFKLHGSLKRWTEHGVYEARETIQATIDTVGESGMEMKFEPGKRRVLRASLTERPLIVLGYSGYDDFDIVPVLASLRSSQELIWINHTSGNAACKHITWTELAKHMPADYAGSFIKKEHDFIYTVGRSGVRSKERLHLFDADSALVIKIIAGRLGLPLIDPPSSREPPRAEALDAYFANWGKRRGLLKRDRYYIAGRIIGSMGRYAEGLAHMLHAHSLYVAAGDPNVLIPVSRFIADYTGRNGDYEVAYRVLESIVPFIDDTPLGPLIVYQLAFLMTKLPQYESLIRPLVERELRTWKSSAPREERSRDADRIIQALARKEMGIVVPDDAFAAGEEALQSIEQDAAATGHTHDHLIQTGKLLFEKKEYTQALSFFQKAFEWAEKLGDTQQMLDDLWSLEAIYYLRNERERALATLELCVVLARQLGNKLMLSRIMGDRGLIQIELGDLAGAATSFDQSIAFGSAAKDPRLMALGYRNRGDVFSQLKDGPSAIDSYDKAAALFREAKMMEESRLAAEKAQALRKSFGR